MHFNAYIVPHKVEIFLSSDGKIGTFVLKQKKCPIYSDSRMVPCVHIRTAPFTMTVL